MIVHVRPAPNPLPVIGLSTILLAFFGYALWTGIEQRSRWLRGGAPFAVDDIQLERQRDTVVSVLDARCGPRIEGGRREPFGGGVYWITGLHGNTPALTDCRCTGPTLAYCKGLVRLLTDREQAYLRAHNYTELPRFLVCSACDDINALAGIVVGTMFCSVAIIASCLAVYQYVRDRRRQLGA